MMPRSILRPVLGLLAVAVLAFGPSYAQDQGAIVGRGSQSGAPNVVSLAFLGDLMLGGDVSRDLADRAPDRFWGDALPLLRRADAVIANLEGPITTSDRRWQRDWKFFHFRADPAAVKILTAGNIRLVALANNHIMDYGGRGLADTLVALDQAGIGHAGAGRNRAEAEASRIVDIHGLKVGLISATDRMSDFAATADGPGTNHLDIRPDSRGLDWIERSVADLRRAGAALIVLSLHWGPDMRIKPNHDFRRFAHAAVDRGVDIIHGHSAHVVQAIERYRRAIILYDTGNFIDDYWKIPFRHTNWSFVFGLTVENGRLARLTLVPIVTHPVPTVATGEIFRAITDNMRSLCDPFDTRIVETAEGLEVPLDDEPTP